MISGEIYKCRIRLRKEFNGEKLKPGTEALDGKIMHLRVMWLIEQDEQYPGEYALGDAEVTRPLITIGNIGWIASGDVEVLSEPG